MIKIHKNYFMHERQLRVMISSHFEDYRFSQAYILNLINIIKLILYEVNNEKKPLKNPKKVL